MIKRNIPLSYILAFSKNTWFWLGIWIFYYLRYTTYSGIGIIETTLILTLTLAEIPTGAFADLVGKKKTIIISFFFETLGAFMMATAANFYILVLSVFVMCIGGALYSGTLESLVYDSLKQNNNEGEYAKKIANINTISLIAPAVCGILGGFMYKIHPSLPFFGNGVGYLIGLFTSLFLIEPQIDSEKFSFANFINQTKQGTRELFKSTVIKYQTILLLSLGCVVVIASEMINSFLGVEFGFKEEHLGILWSAIFLISALASQLTYPIIKFFKSNYAVVFVGIVIAVTFVVSPFIGIFWGGLTLIIRTSFEGIFGNLTSIIINQNTESKYRATTISTFNMIKNIPYVLSAYFIGSISDQFSAKTTSFYMGVIIVILLVFQLILLKQRSTH